MNIADKKRMNSKIIFILMIVLGVGVNIKSIFLDLCIDSSYQISMAYRLAKGDLLFKDMWEVHQTSAFLCEFFIRIYLYLFKTTTGIVLFLQFIGVAIDGVISYLLYKIVSKSEVNKSVALGMAWVFFVVSPKDVPIAEFANMQIWFSMLLCMMLFLYDRTRKKRYLILSALCLCLTILSYPSCLIIFPVTVVFFLYQKQKKEALMFSSVCIIVGALYLGNILRYMGVEELISTIRHMLAIEPTHTVPLSEKFLLYFYDSLKYFFVLFVIYVCSWLIVYGICKFKNKYMLVKKSIIDVFFLILTVVISIYAVMDFKYYARGFYSITFVAFIFVGMKHRKKVNEKIRSIYIYGNLIAMLNFFATLILTDLELITVFPYLLIGMIVSFIPLAELMKEINVFIDADIFKKMLIFLIVALLTFKGVYIIRPMYEWIAPITSVRGIVKEGPAKGFISEYMGPYIQNETLKEWEQYIPDGSRIYLIGGAIDTLPYLYGNTIISAPTVMSTPGYSTSISEYWNEHSDRYPDVVIASCWFGELDSMLVSNEWIMKWLEEEFEPAYYINGKYWRYYYRK